MDLPRYQNQEALLFALLLIACNLIQDSLQDQTNISQRLKVQKSEQRVDIGNTHNYNYNYNVAGANYNPVMSNKVVLNLDQTKLKPKKLRSTRAPSLDEIAIKQRILEVYRKAVEEVHGTEATEGEHLKHLGRILQALNPKYIATRRVESVAFADAADESQVVVPPESETDAPSQPESAQVIELTGNDDEPVQMKLEALRKKFSDLVSWDKQFARKLIERPDADLSDTQAAFKRLLLCLTYPNFCNPSQVRNPVVKKSSTAIAPEQSLSEELDMLGDPGRPQIAKPSIPSRSGQLPRLPDHELWRGFGPNGHSGSFKFAPATEHRIPTRRVTTTTERESAKRLIEKYTQKLGASLPEGTQWSKSSVN